MHFTSPHLTDHHHISVKTNLCFCRPQWAASMSPCFLTALSCLICLLWIITSCHVTSPMIITVTLRVQNTASQANGCKCRNDQHFHENMVGCLCHCFPTFITPHEHDVITVDRQTDGQAGRQILLILIYWSHAGKLQCSSSITHRDNEKQRK